MLGIISPTDFVKGLEATNQIANMAKIFQLHPTCATQSWRFGWAVGAAHFVVTTSLRHGVVTCMFDDFGVAHWKKVHVKQLLQQEVAEK